MLKVKSLLTGRVLIASSAAAQRCLLGASPPDRAISEVLRYASEKSGNDRVKTSTERASLFHVGRRRSLARTFRGSHVELETRSPSEATRNFVTSTTPWFERMWWGKVSDSRKVASIWRPKPPLGYVVLGDYLAQGLEPPSFAVALREDETDTLVKPTTYLQEMSMGGEGLEQVFIWIPIAPPGYVAMGWIATKTQQMPPLDQMRCISIDHVTQIDFSMRPLSSMFTEKDMVDNDCSQWKVEKQVGTFAAGPELNGPPAPMAGSLAKGNHPHSTLEERNQGIHEGGEFELSRKMESEGKEWVAGSHPQSVLEQRNQCVLEGKKFQTPKNRDYKSDECAARNYPQSVLEETNQRVHRGEKFETSKKMDYQSPDWGARVPSESLINEKNQSVCGEPSTKMEHENDGQMARDHPQSVLEEKTQRVPGEEKAKRSENLDHERDHPQSVLEEKAKRSEKFRHERDHPQSVLEEKTQRVRGKEKAKRSEKSDHERYERVRKQELRGDSWISQVSIGAALLFFIGFSVRKLLPIILKLLLV